MTNRSAINPDSDAVKFAQENWHKLLAVMVLKSGSHEIEISAEDIAKLELDPRHNIVIDTTQGRLRLRLIDAREAAKCVSVDNARRIDRDPS